MLKFPVSEKNIFSSKFRKLNDAQYMKTLEEKQMREQEKEAKKLGIDLNKSLEYHETVEDVISSIPNMVLGEITSNSTMYSDNKKMSLKSGEVYVMSYGTYMAAYRERLKNSQIMKPYKKQFKNYFKRYFGQDLTNKNLLVWRSGGIGDILFSQPVISYIKKTYPSCKITFSTSFNNSSIFKCWPTGLVDKVLSMPFLLKELYENNYHLTFEGSIERCKEAEKINCYDIFKKISGLEFNIEDYQIKLIPNEEKVNKFKDIVPENTIIIQMRASSAIRMMNSENWKKIINGLFDMNYNVAVIDSSNTISIYDSFKKEYNLDKLINLSPYSENLDDAISMTSLSKGCITIDSSFSHISAALGIPVIGIYGPFLGHLRMSYYKNSDWVDSDNYLECGKYPCFFHHNRMGECPFVKLKSLPGCLGSINTNIVLDKFKALMDKNKNGK